MDELELIRIKQWVFDPLNRTLTLESSSDAVESPEVVETLESKHALLLYTLVTNQGATLTREQLVTLVWKDRFVDDRTINATISRLRKVLGGKKDEFIKTHPKVGYSFVQEVYFIERQEISKQYVTITTQLKYKQYFWYALVALLFVVIFVTAQQLLVQNASDKPAIPSSEIVPLTYIKGNNYSPSLSPDSQLLAFINQEAIDSKRQVMVQSLDTNQVKAIEADILTGSPYWSRNDNHLYYQAFDNDQCWIRRTTVSPSLEIGKVESITNCGYLPFFQGLSRPENSPWLYFSYGNSTNTPYYVIKKVHIETGKTEVVTSPPVKYKGDFLPRIRKDGKFLAFLRDFDDGSTAIMLNNNDTGEIKQLLKVASSFSSFEWSNDDDSLVYTDENNILTAINIHTEAKRQLLTSSDRLNNPLPTVDDAIIASVGEKFLNSIMIKPLSGDDQSLQTAISSAFRDYGATLHVDNNEKKLAFVSNRSGSNQIWISNGSVQEKLTNFQGMESPRSLRFSPDGSKLLYMYKQQPFLFDLTSKEHIELPIYDQQVKNPIWLCNSSNEFLFISLSGDTWSLLKTNIDTMQTDVVSKNVSSINSDCSTNRYYASLVEKSGLYPINIDEKVVNDSPILPKHEFIHWDYWSTHDGMVYFLGAHNKLLSYDIHSLKTEEVDINELTTRSIRIDSGRLILESIDINNTFIGRVTTL
ncbi:winged helix-turn-helix domain-containing protein [Thalassotalea fusca]